MFNIPANLQLPLMIVESSRQVSTLARSMALEGHFMQLKISDLLVTGSCCSSIPCVRKQFLHVEPFLDS